MAMELSKVAESVCLGGRCTRTARVARFGFPFGWVKIWFVIVQVRRYPLVWGARGERSGRRQGLKDHSRLSGRCCRARVGAVGGRHNVGRQR